MPKDSSFLPNIKCPHCHENLVTSLSGFGSELSVREKECYKCNKTYYLQVYVTTTKEKSVIDGLIKSIKRRIDSLKQQRSKTLGQVLYLEQKEAARILKEADEIALQMYLKYLNRENN